MPKKLRSQPVEITLAREEEAFNHRTNGWTQQRIANHMGLSQCAISKMLERVTKRYSKLFMDKVQIVKAEQVAIHNKIVMESLESWENSKGLHKTEKNKAKGIVNKKGVQETIGGDRTVEEKQLFGDTRYLDASMKAMEHIRKVMGVDILDLEQKDPVFKGIKLTLIGKDGQEIRLPKESDDEPD
jgi:hypothetical protein